MASNYAVAHRFVNRDYNFERGLKGNSTHIIGKNYYSYSTVFAQWVDEKLCIVFDGETSVTSNKHKIAGSYFPEDVVVLPYDDGGSGNSYYWASWHGCDLLGYSNVFKYEHRVELIDYYVQEMYNALEAIVDGKKKNLDLRAKRTIDAYWEYINTLCCLYRDTSITKWLRIKGRNTKEWKAKKTLVRSLTEGISEVSELVDLMFGEGTWKAYYDYCARYRKAADKRAKVEALCGRLGIASPYESWTRGRMHTELTADDIRKLTAKERLDIHFRAIAHKEYEEHEDERKKKYNKNMRNAYKWIVGFEPKQKSWGGGYENDVRNNCVNKDSGVVYECSGEYIFGFYWLDTSVSFDYDGFRKSEDKEKWIEDFYAKCNDVANNRKAIYILKRIKAHTKEKARSWYDDVYINDDYLRENTTDAEYNLCAEFIRKQDKHFADKEAQRRAAEIERLRREEEERKEREYMEQVKQEQIDECVARGVEGCRDLWRKHLMDIHTASYRSNEKDNVYYYGGNVLLRMNLNKDKVETSKDIRIPVDTCKKMWKIVSKWHENPSCFKPMQIDTKGSGKYTISSYQNDILTAGCHKIAYAEMEHMYNEIVALENETA